MQESKLKRQTALMYSLSFFIPIVMMIVISVILGMYPFGERTILISDMNKQFNDYFAYFKTIVTGENNLIYTFSKNLGGDMIGFSAYYLQNPFLLVLLLFPNHILPLGIWVMIILQVASCSLTFNIYLNRTNTPSMMSIIFSLAYAFMGYIFGYIYSPNYFCNIIVLPLVMLGIHKILKNYKDFWLYMITLALSILLNYYLGYMLCIFSVLFFLYLLIIKTEWFRHIKEYGKQIVSFLVASVLGAALTAFNLIPIVFSLQGQKEVPTGSSLSFYRNFPMINVFSKLYSNMFDGNTSNDNFPFIYVGIIAVIFVCFYFLSKEISVKEKIVTAGFLCIMLMCFYIHTLDVIWHGFNEPVGFPYRDVFYFSFLLLMIAYQGFTVSCRQLKMKECSIFAAVFVLYSIYLFMTNKSALVFRSIIFDSILLILLIAVIYGTLYLKWSQNVLFFSILAIQIFDLSSNAVTSVKQYTDYVPMQEYSEYISQTEPLIQYVKEQDDSLYRMEKNFERSHNDSMQFNYRGLSHSSSCEKDYVKNFMEKLGFRNFGLWAYYDEGGTAFADCFLGIKYYISQFDATGKPYELIYQENQKYVFQNPYALPLAFGVREQARSVAMSEKNSFLLQNEMAGIFGKEAQIYSEVKQEKRTLVNLEETEEEAYEKLTRLNAEEDAYIEYKLKITKNQPVYLFFEAPERQAAEITVDDFWYGNYFSDTKWDIIEIGSHQEGDIVSVKLYVKGDDLRLGNAYFYYEDKDILIDMYQQAELEVAELECVSDSHLQGTVQITDSDYLLFTIPYEQDWKIWIDGNETEQIEVFDALMAVPVTEGTHTIELRYIPRGFIAGAIISALAVLVCMLLFFKKGRASNEIKAESKPEGQSRN